MEDEYTGIDCQHDPDFYLEGYSVQELQEKEEQYRIYYEKQ